MKITINNMHLITKSMSGLGFVEDELIKVDPDEKGCKPWEIQIKLPAHQMLITIVGSMKIKTEKLEDIDELKFNTQRQQVFWDEDEITFYPLTKKVFDCKLWSMGDN